MTDPSENPPIHDLDGSLTELQPEFVAESLRRFGQEIVHISDRLASLLHHAGESLAQSGQEEGLAERVAAVIKAREARGRLFPPSLFSDPAWDILLHLLRAEIGEVRISFTRLAARANIPATTAGRWVTIMVDKGMVIRSDDQRDSRRTFIELHPDTSAALRELIAAQPALSGI